MKRNVFHAVEGIDWYFLNDKKKGGEYNGDDYEYETATHV